MVCKYVCKKPPKILYLSDWIRDLYILSIPRKWEDIPVSAVLFFRRLSSVPGGRAAKASSVGANTVKGPGPEKDTSVQSKSLCMTGRQLKIA